MTFAQSGKVTGGQKYHMPSWFKTSFLDLPEDIAEATEEGKHLAVFFHLDECPYCAKMLSDNLTEGPNQQFAAQHFDFVGLNVKGNLEVTWVDGQSYTLSSLARHLGVFATPTIQVFSSTGQRVLNLQGYRGPQAFRQAMEYVQTRSYLNQSFKAYQESAAAKSTSSYQPLSHPLFSQSSSLVNLAQPVAVLFESKQCDYCQRFHEKTLNHPKVLEALKPYQFVRVMVDGNKEITTPAGEKLTERAWAEQLNITYTPSLLLYKNGKLLRKIETALYQQHLRESLLWVANWKPSNYPTLRQFKDDFRQSQMARGENVDYSE